MGWQDRDYNAGRENLNSYFANPAALLAYSLPIFKSPTLYIRLHFWFLLFALFHSILLVRTNAPYFYIPLDFAILLSAVLLHELGHRLFAKSVGGNHWEWVLWPLGGMVPPNSPTNPKSIFIANIGGLAFTLPLALLAATALHFLPGAAVFYAPILDPFNPLDVAVTFTAAADPVLAVAGHILGYFITVSAAIFIINLFPAYWFDGGYIWQSLLSPALGKTKAIRVTCMTGMILAVPFFILALPKTDLFVFIIWALIFSDCFVRRRAAAANPFGEEDYEAVSYNYMDNPHPHHHKKLNKRWLAKTRKKAKADQVEQAKIDAILAKVKDKGLHSLSWFEKRTLRKATARQRQQDLAERL